LKIFRIIGPCALLLSLQPGVAEAQSHSPFQEFAGTWSGSGSLSRDDGSTERLRCKADYEARGDMLRQSLTCSSDRTSFALTNTIQESDGKLSGEWKETTRNARGEISGSLTKGVMRGTAQGPGFSAGIAVAVRGRRQTVSIRARGGDISTVNIALVRGR
jgi:hypothetical protein